MVCSQKPHTVSHVLSPKFELSYKYINYSRGRLKGKHLYASVLGSAQCFKRIVVIGQSKKCLNKAQETWGGWMIRRGKLNEIVNWSERKVSKPKCSSTSNIVGYKCSLYMEVQGKCQKPKCRCSLVCPYCPVPICKCKEIHVWSSRKVPS